MSYSSITGDTAILSTVRVTMVIAQLCFSETQTIDWSRPMSPAIYTLMSVKVEQNGEIRPLHAQKI